MKKDLKSSKHSAQTGKQAESKPREQQAENVPPELASFLQSVQGKSQKELQQDFYRTARKHVAQGTFDEKALVRMIDRLGPMITPEQRTRMLELLHSVRGSD